MSLLIVYLPLVKISTIFNVQLDLIDNRGGCGVWQLLKELILRACKLKQLKAEQVVNVTHVS